MTASIQNDSELFLVFKIDSLLGRFLVFTIFCKLRTVFRWVIPLQEICHNIVDVTRKKNAWYWYLKWEKLLDFMQSERGKGKPEVSTPSPEFWKYICTNQEWPFLSKGYQFLSPEIFSLMIWWGCPTPISIGQRTLNAEGRIILCQELYCFVVFLFMATMRSFPRSGELDLFILWTPL